MHLGESKYLFGICNPVIICKLIRLVVAGLRKSCALYILFSLLIVCKERGKSLIKSLMKISFRRLTILRGFSPLFINHLHL